MTYLLIMTQVPTSHIADQITQVLLEKRLAACVTQLAVATSRYSWEGKIEEASEIPLLIKTRETLYALVEETIRSIHPYQVPEIIAYPISHGAEAYLQWIDMETQATIP